MVAPEVLILAASKVPNIIVDYVTTEYISCRGMGTWIYVVPYC